MFKKCVTCKKEKFWFLVKIRKYKLPKINLPVQSTGELCGKCFKNIKRVVDTGVKSN